MSISKRSLHERGFTIVELLIATTVFSFVLLVAGSGIVAIGRMYFKNINSNRVQEASRSVMEDVTRSIQFSSGSIETGPTVDDVRVRCFGNDRYTYIINDPVGVGDGPQYGVKIDSRPSPGCLTGVVDGVDLSPGTDAKQLLGKNMRLLQFDIGDGENNDANYKINIKVAYGDSDLLTIYNDDSPPTLTGPADDAFIASALCKGGPGSTFCSTAGLETAVTYRIE